MKLSPTKSFRSLAVVALAAIAVTSIACTAESPDEPLVLRIGTNTEVTNWSPLNSYNTPDFWVAGQLYPQLFSLSVAGEFVDHLATDYEVAPDGTSLKLFLDSRFKWSDGEAITSEDVKFTFERFKSDKLLSGSSVAANYKSAEIVSDTELVLYADQPSYGWALDILRSISILPEHVFSKFENLAEISIESDPALFVGGGSFVLSKIVPGQYYQFVPNEFYPLRASGNEKISAMEFVVYPDLNVMQLALQAGEIDLMAPIVPAAAVDSLAQVQGIGIQRVDLALNYTKLSFNVSRNNLADAELRRIISGLIDPQELLAAVLQGNGLVPVGPVLPTHYENYQPEIEPWRIDLDSAKAELKAKGYTNLNFKLLCDSGNSNHLKYAQLIRDRLIEAGIQVELACVERTISLEQARSGDFDLYIHKLNQSWAPGVNLTMQFHPDNPARLNYNFLERSDLQNEVKDQQLRELLDRISTAVSETEYYETSKAAAAYIHQQAYILPLYVEALNSAYRADRYSGFYPTGMETSTMMNTYSLGQVVPVR